MAMDDFKAGYNKAKLESDAKELGKALKRLLRQAGVTDGGDKFAPDLEKHGEELKRTYKAYKEAKASGVGLEGAEKALKNAHATASGIAKGAKEHFSGIKSQIRGQRFGRIVNSKPLMVTAAVVGAITAAAMFSSKRAKQERADEIAGREQKTQEMREDVAALRAAQNSQNTMMGLPPTPGDHAARVLSARNGAAAGVDTSNPPVDLNYQVVR